MQQKNTEISVCIKRTKSDTVWKDGHATWHTEGRISIGKPTVIGEPASAYAVEAHYGKFCTFFTCLSCLI